MMFDDNTTKVHCLQCQRSDYEVPLVPMRFRGRTVWICAQCLPILIHNPARLTTKFPVGKELTTGPLV